MKRETINTFSDGMSLDLNPLGTPAKTLTNCLNGTLITYNGNELTLQNDMGNVPVGTAALPKGYVPVGMKEYGGIIYVASYNPETKKGQLGCFPSPQQIYTSEAAQTVFDFNIQDQFIEFFNNFPIIQNNEYKEEIFKDSITQEAKIFSSGDLFLIKTNNIYSDSIRTAIDKGIITLKLFVVPINGDEPLDITDQLHTYPDNWKIPLWIYQNVDNIPFETLLANHRDLLQTYKGLQGVFQIVIEFNTFELFNLYRIFSRQENNFSVKFIGEANPDNVKIQDLMPFGLFGNINYQNHNINDIEQLGEQSNPNKLIAQTDKHTVHNNKSLYYDIMPGSPYGILKLANNSFLKSGELTSQGIIDSHNKITNWNFEINSDSALLQWTYTLFEDDPEIDHMRFVFIPLDNVLEQGGKTKYEIDQLYISEAHTSEYQSSNIYTIKKPFYSGDFEDLIKIEDTSDGLLHNYIYLCRLDIIYNDGGTLRAENGHDYKLLYTGTFFNDKDVSNFNDNNRPEVTANIDLDVQQTYTVKSFNYTTFLEDANGNIVPSQPKEIVTANDIMFLANNELYYKKIVGIILNVECEVTSTLSIKDEDIVQYKDEKLPFRPSFAGRVAIEQTLDACAVNGKITCTIESKTNPSYEGDGDLDVQKELKKYIVEEEIDDQNSGNYKPLDGATITYTKQGPSYQNTSTIKIHRGIVSRMGQEDFYSVLLESLFPVYEPDDTLYNERMFGFNLDEDGNLSNIIGGENFMGLSMWLAKNRALDATTSTKDSMINIERSYSKKTSLSRYDFKGNAQTPYHYGSYISDGIGIVNYGSEGTSRIEAMQKYNYAPIQIVASNEYERVWDKSYWDGDVDSRICNLMILPHSEFGENLRKEVPTKLQGTFLSDEFFGWDKDKEKKYGKMAYDVRIYHTDGVIDSVGEKKRNLFKVSRGNTKGMYILWRSQYGYQLMNIATPLNIESSQEPSELITVNVKDDKNLKVIWDTNDGKNKTYPACETHLRADHMLLCLLSQILITKRKSTDLLLNAPDVSHIYSTTAFKNKGLLSINNISNPIIVLNDKNVEEALQYILNNDIISYSDNFIPKFKVNEYSNGYIDCGGKISISSNRFGMINLDNLFFAEGTPEFSNVTNEERVNIYPGKIEKVFGQYLCKIEKDKFGLYQINEDLIKVVDGKRKFYKIFLPTIHSHTNKEGAKYNCKNTKTYKQMLEGFAYNDVLLPLTRIMQLQGRSIGQLNSQEDLESPFFNLLYYNSIDLNFELEPSNLDEFVMHDVDCGCSVPVDYCHGFAFITLFGDQSRYLDSGVYLRNQFNVQAFSGADINLGYTNSNRVDGYKCSCHDVFGVDRRAYRSRTLMQGSNQFKLGTQDWATAKITLSTFDTASNTSDDNESKSNKEEDVPGDTEQ